MKRGRKSKYDIEINKSKVWNVAVYIRLSVQDGDKAESNSVINQKELLNMYLEQNKELNVKEYYIDDGFSGTTFDRPAFKKMMKDIEKEIVNTVIVKDLSRFGRNYIEVGNKINSFMKDNIRFISVCEKIDSYKDKKSVDDIIFPLKNIMNEMYCKDVSDKLIKTFEVMKKEGKYIGGIPPFGYIRDENNKHKLIVDEASASVVRRIFDLCESGIGNVLITKELNEKNVLTPSEYNCKILKITSSSSKVAKQWTASIVGKILDNRVYCGDLVQNKGKLISYKIHKRVLVPQEEWIIVKDTHDAIIDRDTFDKVQKAILDRDTRMNTDGKISIFAGHIKCGDCQRAMSKKIPGKYKGQPRNYYHYMCSAYMRSGGEICTKHSIKNDELEKAVLESVKVQIGLIIDMKRIKGQIDSKTFNDNRRSYLLENINKCEETLNIKRKLRKEAYEDWKLGIITEKEYNDYTQEYGRQIRENEAYIEENYKELQNLDKMSTSGEWIEYFEKYQNVNSLSRELIDGLIDDIYVYEDKKIKVKFKYEDEYNYLIQYIKRRKGDIL